MHMLDTDTSLCGDKLSTVPDPDEVYKQIYTTMTKKKLK